jgi:hypothetical protein
VNRFALPHRSPSRSRCPGRGPRRPRCRAGSSPRRSRRRRGSAGRRRRAGRSHQAVDDLGDVPRHRAAVGVAQHDALGAGLGRGGDDLTGVVVVAGVAVEEVLGVEEDALAEPPQVGDRVGHHGEVLGAGHAERLVDVVAPGLADQADDVGAGVDQRPEQRVVLGAVLAACGSSRRRRAWRCRAPARRRRHGEELGVLGVRARASRPRCRRRRARPCAGRPGACRRPTGVTPSRWVPSRRVVSYRSSPGRRPATSRRRHWWCSRSRPLPRHHVPGGEPGTREPGMIAAGPLPQPGAPATGAADDDDGHGDAARGGPRSCRSWPSSSSRTPVRTHATARLGAVSNPRGRPPHVVVRRCGRRVSRPRGGTRPGS